MDNGGGVAVAENRPAHMRRAKVRQGDLYDRGFALMEPRKPFFTVKPRQADFHDIAADFHRPTRHRPHAQPGQADPACGADEHGRLADEHHQQRVYGLRRIAAILNLVS